MSQTLAIMQSLCRRGFAFNMLTTYSDPEKQRDDLFYADPPSVRLLQAAVLAARRAAARLSAVRVHDHREEVTPPWHRSSSSAPATSPGSPTSTSRPTPSTRSSAFTVDAEYCREDTFLDLPLVPLDRVTTLLSAGGVQDVRRAQLREDEPRARREVHQTKALGYELVSYVSSRCTFLSQHPPGDNCFILEDNTVQPFVQIGSNVTLWSGNHIGHDSTIGDHCFISSHVVVSGHVSVAEGCFIGVNATLRDSISIAEYTLDRRGRADHEEHGTEVGLPGRAAPSGSRKSSDDVDL